MILIRNISCNFTIAQGWSGYLLCLKRRNFVSKLAHFLVPKNLEICLKIVRYVDHWRKTMVRHVVWLCSYPNIPAWIHLTSYTHCLVKATCRGQSLGHALLRLLASASNKSASRISKYICYRSAWTRWLIRLCSRTSIREQSCKRIAISYWLCISLT